MDFRAVDVTNVFKSECPEITSLGTDSYLRILFIPEPVLPLFWLFFFGGGSRDYIARIIRLKSGSLIIKSIRPSVL